jgi:hypothetical protein
MSPQEEGCAGHSLLWRQARVYVWPDALLGRVQATRPCHTHLPCRHHESASSNRKATSDLRCHASQTDPQTHSRGSLTHPAHKIGGIPAADFAINNPASQRPECHDADNPSWDVPNNSQPSSDTGSDTRAALQKRAWPITAGASAQVGEAREPTRRRWAKSTCRHAEARNMTTANLRCRKRRSHNWPA